MRNQSPAPPARAETITAEEFKEVTPTNAIKKIRG